MLKSVSFFDLVFILIMELFCFCKLADLKILVWIQSGWSEVAHNYKMFQYTNFKWGKQIVLDFNEFECLYLGLPPANRTPKYLIVQVVQLSIFFVFILLHVPSPMSPLLSHGFLVKACTFTNKASDIYLMFVSSLFLKETEVGMQHSETKLWAFQMLLTISDGMLPFKGREVGISSQSNMNHCCETSI